MEVEHVNENMIRVVLGSQDLEQRGVTILDLLGNRKQIETFFYNILEEVDTDHSFIKDQSVTFQVVPKAQGLELLITKAPADEDEESYDVSAFREAMAALEEITNSSEEEEASEEPDLEEIDDKQQQTLIFSFNSFEDFISLSKVLKVEGVTSNLYQYKQKYYLELFLYPDDMHTADVTDVTSLTKEYGTLETISPEVVSEFGKLLIKNLALETARYYFN